MVSCSFTGSIVEHAALTWFATPRDALLPKLISGGLRVNGMNSEGADHATDHLGPQRGRKQ
jgi:hypothetical protein